MFLPCAVVIWLLLCLHSAWFWMKFFSLGVVIVVLYWSLEKPPASPNRGWFPWGFSSLGFFFTWKFQLCICIPFSSVEQGRSLTPLSLVSCIRIWFGYRGQKSWGPGRPVQIAGLSLCVACLPCSTLGAFLRVVWASLP